MRSDNHAAWHLSSPAKDQEIFFREHVYASIQTHVYIHIYKYIYSCIHIFIFVLVEFVHLFVVYTYTYKLCCGARVFFVSDLRVVCVRPCCLFLTTGGKAEGRNPTNRLRAGLYMLVQNGSSKGPGVKRIRAASFRM